MSEQTQAGAYEPRPGETVTVTRWVQTTAGARSDFTVQTGVVATAEPHLDGWFITLEGCDTRIFTGYQFLGAGGTGGPASLVTEVTPTAPEAYRVQVNPDLAVVVDGSQCIVLEVSDTPGHVIRRVTITHLGDFKRALGDAYDAQQLAIARGWAERDLDRARCRP